jgi:preprotein translocase subunit SecA
MAGRGTDILLGGNPAGLASEILHRKGLNPAEVDKETYDAALAEAKRICDEDHEKVVAVGGLHIIGTERHDSRRIDNQLRGRAGRQGDPGSSRFYLSLEDDLMKRFASDRVAGLMERLGLEEDMAIESRLVSKTIESAQSRVEGYNFDIRKHVVEYDDVINKQRETIYEERDKVLRNEDLTDTVQGFVDQEIDALVDQHLSPGLPMDEWNMAGMLASIEAMGLGGPDLTEDSLWDLNGREAVAAFVKDRAAERLEQKDAENSEEWSLIERLVLLRTIDSVWVEHLTEVDEMRQGIGLRGIAQEDPLNAFKKEAFALFEEMLAIIRHQVATTIFRVSIVRQQPPPEGVEGTGAVPADSSPEADAAAQRIAKGMSGLRKPLPQGRAVGGSSNASSGGSGGAIRPGYSPAGIRMGRNDACWCNSGLKYKKCHGK